MGVLTSQQSEADKITAQVKEMIDQGQGSKEIAEKLSIRQAGVLDIILQRKDRICAICKGTGRGSIVDCPACKGLGAT